MKLVVQRVNFANVSVDSKIVGEIDKGLLVYLGVSSDFSFDKLDFICDKLLKLRLWGSDKKGAVTSDGRSAPFLEDKPRKKGFDLSVRDVNGGILVISQFTLFGDCKKGTKPNFAKAAGFEFANEVYEKFILKLKESGLKIESGEFGAMMKINSENDGPVTIILEK